ncbi:MAG: lysophospholipase [Acidimicrobiia bacterium]
MKATTGTRSGPDGTALHTRHWAAASPRAAIVLVHGVAEHLGRYEQVGAALSDRGFDVRGTDLRGFGMSEGRRAYVENFSDYATDLVDDIATARELGVPVVLLGHSMGGLIASLYAVTSHPQPDLLVLSAPAIDADLPKAKVAMARLLVRVLPKLTVSNGLDGDQLSRDSTVGERYFADPLVFAKSTIRLGVELIGAMEQARSSLHEITMPTLVIHGGDDTIIDPSFSEPYAALTDSTRVVFDGFRHESFNEDGGSLAVSTISDWIDARI